MTDYVKRPSLIPVQLDLSHVIVILRCALLRASKDDSP